MTLNDYVFTCILFARAFPYAKKTWVVLATGRRSGAAYDRLYFLMVKFEDGKLEVEDELVLPMSHLAKPSSFGLYSWGDITARLDIEESGGIFISLDDSAGSNPDAFEIYDICLPIAIKEEADMEDEEDVQD